MPANVHNLHNINAIFNTIVCSLGVGPSTITNRLYNRFMRAREVSELKNFAFSNHKSHIFLHVYIHFPYFLISWNILESFHFPENYPETIMISQNSGNFLQSGNTEIYTHNDGKDRDGKENRKRQFYRKKGENIRDFTHIYIHRWLEGQKGINVVQQCSVEN